MTRRFAHTKKSPPPPPPRTAGRGNTVEIVIEVFEGHKTKRKEIHRENGTKADAHRARLDSPQRSAHVTRVGIDKSSPGTARHS